MSEKKIVLFWILFWDPVVLVLWGTMWPYFNSLGSSLIVSLLTFYVFTLLLFFPAILYLFFIKPKKLDTKAK